MGSSRFLRPLLKAIGTGALLAAPASAFLLGCAPQEVPGVSKGSHLFRGALMENTCGPNALPAENAIEMRAELRADGPLGVFRRPNQPIFYGSALEDDKWRFELSSVINVYDYDPVSGHGPCAFQQVESIRLDPMEADEDEDETEEDVAGRYEGRSLIRLIPTEGSDCRASVALFGGPFYELPCQAEYQLVSEPIEPIFEDENTEDDMTAE